MTDFAAIDFETANQEPTSVCSVGIVVVRAGEITDRFYSLIKPEPDYYCYWNTAVHSLTEADTCDAPVFPKVWELAAPRVEGLTLVAHNAPFDRGCLQAVLRCYQLHLDYPKYAFKCTLAASRRHFGKQLPNHQLQTVAAACGFDLVHHHNALDDALACAWIARSDWME